MISGDWASETGMKGTVNFVINVSIHKKSRKTKRTVLERTRKWWGESKNVDEYFVDFLKDKRYRSDDVLMPCCFSKKIQKKNPKYSRFTNATN